MSKILVRVPASTSNLGPGFDLFGLALTLYNEIELEASPEPGPISVEIEGEGAESLPRDSSNLVVRAALRSAGLPRHRHSLRFRLRNRIPIARGLGSSAAARLGGILAGRALRWGARRAKDQRALEEACRLEGHPDNACASFYGGLRAVIRHGGRLIQFDLRAASDLNAVVCAPDFHLSTEKARGILPERVPRADAAANVANAVLLSYALEHRRYEWLQAAMEDRLHQPYRRRLIPGMESVIRSALKAGAWGAALSGSGPSIFAFSPKSKARQVAAAMQKAFGAHRVRSRPWVLGIDRRGAVVERKA